MAIITIPKDTRFDIKTIAPAGTHVGTCIGVNDRFGAQRPNYDHPQIMEARDVTRFLFGFRGVDGRLHRVESFEFRISGNSKANLMKFLASWLGYSPEDGWDYCEQVGQGALVTVAHKPSADRSRTFANIAGIAPVPESRVSEILPLQSFSPPPPAPSLPASIPPAPPTH